MRKPAAWILFSISLYSCQPSETPVEPPSFFPVPDSLDPVPSAGLPSPVFRNGKLRRSRPFHELFRTSSLDTLDVPIIDRRLLKGLDNQRKLLNQTRQAANYRIGNIAFGRSQLLETIEILRSRQHTKPVDLHELLDAYEIWGEDRKGNVQFTGYFTPVIPVREKPDAEFCFPIYDRPRDWEGALPTRAEIEGQGALMDMGLELAYARSRVDIYYMQLQGSGFVEYPDGSRRLFSYNGTNRHPYRSIEKYLLSRPDWEVRNLHIPGIKSFLEEHPHLVDSVLFHNPSYTFFKSRSSEPKGAGMVPLQADLSVAVDKRYLPLGSCLLAAVPVYDERRRRIVGHEYRILLAQDTGGRIKGPGHVDLYFGTGSEARARAGAMKHYGRLWLLLPKRPHDLYTLNE